jgi:putative endonuclease
MPRQPCVYILASRTHRLYIGVTSNLERRWHEHQAGIRSRFPRMYRIDRLVHVEFAPTMGDAIRREKQLKGWVRAKKLALIGVANPSWTDLAEGYGWKRRSFDCAP